MLRLGDCRDILRTLPDNSVDSIVTDPPYEMGFMGKKWDATGIAYDVNVWHECLRVLKPGGHLLAFGGSRTYHRLACAVEDAGFEIRDQIMWIYGSGFPKSLAVDKAIDKAAGAERKVIGVYRVGGNALTPTKDKGGTYGVGVPNAPPGDLPITAPATPDALLWQGWGTALKPAHEPIVLARKPLAGTVAANVLEWGCGALNIDQCRVGYGEDDETLRFSGPGSGLAGTHVYSGGWYGEYNGPAQPHPDSARHDVRGRFPANVIHDGSDEVVGLFPSGAGDGAKNRSYKRSYGNNGTVAKGKQYPHESVSYTDGSGSAARFFYAAKASKADRDEGLEGMPMKHGFDKNTSKTIAHRNADTDEVTYSEYTPSSRRNHHPTVKPTALMRYLCRLVTPPGGVILDPFMGSGSTGKAAVLEGFGFIGIEKEAEYMEIAERRIAYVQRQPALMEAAQ